MPITNFSKRAMIAQSALFCGLLSLSAYAQAATPAGLTTRDVLLHLTCLDTLSQQDTVGSFAGSDAYSVSTYQNGKNQTVVTFGEQQGDQATCGEITLPSNTSVRDVNQLMAQLQPAVDMIVQGSAAKDINVSYFRSAMSTVKTNVVPVSKAALTTGPLSSILSAKQKVAIEYARLAMLEEKGGSANQGAPAGAIQASGTQARGSIQTTSAPQEQSNENAAVAEQAQQQEAAVEGSAAGGIQAAGGGGGGTQGGGSHSSSSSSSQTTIERNTEVTEPGNEQPPTSGREFNWDWILPERPGNSDGGSGGGGSQKPGQPNNPSNPEGPPDDHSGQRPPSNWDWIFPDRPGNGDDGSSGGGGSQKPGQPNNPSNPQVPPDDHGGQKPPGNWDWSWIFPRPGNGGGGGHERPGHPNPSNPGNPNNPNPGDNGGGAQKPGYPNPSIPGNPNIPKPGDSGGDNGGGSGDDDHSGTMPIDDQYPGGPYEPPDDNGENPIGKPIAEPGCSESPGKPCEGNDAAYTDYSKSIVNVDPAYSYAEFAPNVKAAQEQCIADPQTCKYSHAVWESAVNGAVEELEHEYCKENPYDALHCNVPGKQTGSVAPVNNRPPPAQKKPEYCLLPWSYLYTNLCR